MSFCGPSASHREPLSPSHYCLESGAHHIATRPFELEWRAVRLACASRFHFLSGTAGPSSGWSPMSHPVVCGAERCICNLGFQAWPSTASDSLRCCAAASQAPSAPSFRHGDRMAVSCQAAQRSACAPFAVACALPRRRERRGQ
ncbi:hypothetical protein L1887_53587 [Cichorium endivia]|nr:hypothetical protein L1887_53587 [Cichorium endivia]